MKKALLWRAAAVIALFAASAAIPGAAPAGADGQVGAQQPSESPDTDAQSSAPKARRGTCEDTRKRLPEYAQAAGVQRVACLEPADSGGAAGTSDGAMAAESVVAPPPWCGTGGVMRYTRTAACQVSSWYIQVFNADTGAIVGRLDFNAINYSYTSTSIHAWGHQLSIYPTSMWGAATGTTVTGYATCISGAACVPDGSSFPVQPVVVGQWAEGDSYFTTTVAAPGSQGFATTSYLAEFMNPTWAGSVIISEDQMEVRCDNSTPGVNSIGCVFWEYVPSVSYALTGPYPVFAKHVADAQASGLPGAVTPLHRTTDPWVNSQNRATACPGSMTRPPGMSCDEYPFASTYEGAFLSGGGPRTFPYCGVLLVSQSTGPNGYSVCMIEAGQNSGAGTQLGAMYRNNRVIDGDPFRVVITN